MENLVYALRKLNDDEGHDEGQNASHCEGLATADSDVDHLAHVNPGISAISEKETVCVDVGIIVQMDKCTAPFEGIEIPGRRKRSQRKPSQASSQPKPDSQPLLEGRGQSSLLSEQLSDSSVKVCSDENAGYNGRSKRKVFNLNQCALMRSSGTKVSTERAHKRLKGDEGFTTLCSNGSLIVDNEQREGMNQKLHNGGSAPSRHNGGSAPSRQQGFGGDGVATKSKFKKFKLKVGGVTRTIEAKPTSHATSGSGSSTKSAQISDSPRALPNPILQDVSDEDSSPLDKNSDLKGIPWKDFSKGDFNHMKEIPTGKMCDKNIFRKQSEKSDQDRKNKRVSKKRELSGEFDDGDDEIRYLEKLKTSKIAARCKGAVEESGTKERSLSKVLKVGNLENAKDFGPSRSDKDGKKAKLERVQEDTDYEEEEKQLSEGEPEGKQKKLGKDNIDSPAESKREIGLTTRQRALVSGKDSSYVAGANAIEFPNGLPPPPPRTQKEKLTEVEQQLKKAEAAERRRLQREKAARESEAEAIRKILGQDSSRKKREDKIKKRQEELAQERAANARTLPPNTIRCVMGPTGTTVTFSEDVGLPHIFEPKPCSYPPPREKCAGPSCSNPYRYRDSKTKVPLCSLQCYKAIHEKMQGGDTSC
ncbi:PAPA-1 domain-containing protein [Heracleum sosnowskyi]|uniref:PAPA-1 domain-containing protein n=1 Tax=Heracleum sosnowskyi TaxID=360622 RepID=A0AAD8JA76_9APIA|nr:PAPA-1 domain-containing protein [Heracleum sosnowskyi]